MFTKNLLPILINKYKQRSIFAFKIYCTKSTNHKKILESNVPTINPLIIDNQVEVPNHQQASSTSRTTIIDNLESNIKDRDSQIDWTHELNILKFEESKSVIKSLDDYAEEIEITPYVQPTFNLAAYVNQSETLKQLIRLGVDLNRIERRKGFAQFLLKLQFENDIKPYLQFFHDIGIESNVFGELITKNPLIFREQLENLETRINYLQSKNFKQKHIIKIIEKNPFWLMYSTQRIDNRLGFFQKSFRLTGKDIRFLSVKQPKLITYNLEHIRKQTFSIREEMGFDSNDLLKELLLVTPKIWMMEQYSLMERYDYISKVMNISNKQLIQSPEILNTRLYRIKQRHEFLVTLNRAQYNPKLPLYVSLKHLVSGTNDEFILNVAKSTRSEFDKFLRNEW